MQNNNQNYRYILYARKSGEGEDRQVQSIPDQIDRLMKLAKDMGLNVIGEPMFESKSAKKPFNRPVFDELLKRIERGEAEGILSWQLNRLTRNPIESGTLSWMLQQNVLKSIQTIDRQYLPEDNVIIFNVETGTANQFIIDLKKGVKRGIDSKLTRGWFPGIAPLGYLNTKTEIRGDNYIIKDPVRFDIIRKAWDMMLSGTYTPPQILEILNGEHAFRTRTMKKRGNKPLGRSTIYRIFTDPFYAGLFTYNGRQYPGNHDKMI
jgi:site-specific DNA recombinase